MYHHHNNNDMGAIRNFANPLNTDSMERNAAFNQCACSQSPYQSQYRYQSPHYPPPQLQYHHSHCTCSEPACGCSSSLSNPSPPSGGFPFPLPLGLHTLFQPSQPSQPSQTGQSCQCSQQPMPHGPGPLDLVVAGVRFAHSSYKKSKVKSKAKGQSTNANDRYAYMSPHPGLPPSPPTATGRWDAPLPSYETSQSQTRASGRPGMSPNADAYDDNKRRLTKRALE